MIPRDVIDELYGVDPGDFVPTRTRLGKAARDAGDRDLAGAITELRKPTLGAWAVNMLVRERPAEVERLIDVGRRIREAQSRLDAAALRSLRSERDAVLDSFTRAARFVADARGHGLSVGAAATVRATGVAALADEHAAAAVADGTLVRTLDYAGFGEVDLSDAVAARVAGSTEGAPPPADAAPHESHETHDTAEARRRHAARLRDALERADQELARTSLVEAEAVRRAEKAHQRVEEFTRLLEAARAEADERAVVAAQATEERATAAEAHATALERLTAHEGT